jgi:DNA end-binding protein Ku
MATTWKGMISFGLVNIPVKASPAARGDKGVSFNQIHGKCGGRIKQPKHCPHCERDVEFAELVKGYEVSEGTFVTVTDEELKACKPESDATMKIESFVPASEVDPMLFESSFYLEPEKAGKMAYKLLLEALEDCGRYGIASIVMGGQREHVAIIRPYRGYLAFHTMYYADEVRETPNIMLDDIKIKPQELALAQKLIEANAESFDHCQYFDHYTRAVEEMLEAKAQGKAPKAAPKKEAKADVLDLMSALSMSIDKKASGKATKEAKTGGRKKIA